MEAVVSALVGLVGVLVGGIVTYMVNVRSTNRELVSSRKEERYRSLLKELLSSKGRGEAIRQQLIEMYLFCPPEITQKVWKYLDWYAENEVALKDFAAHPDVAQQFHAQMSDLVFAMRADIQGTPQTPQKESPDWIRLPIRR